MKIRLGIPGVLAADLTGVVLTGETTAEPPASATFIHVERLSFPTALASGLFVTGRTQR
jgi:hypothetical protein